jgi:hypothetical protein
VIRAPGRMTSVVRASATRELIATGLYEIAAIKGRLVSADTSGPNKIRCAEILAKWVVLIQEFYDGPLPEPMTTDELKAYRRGKAA